ncbi:MULTISPECIES: DeoR/GlpR family DNA-binding transcription regulator [unclassified Allobranchiibius]|uniref:DeoR/GlpR family DNA-binding transcription regulator n=1 Tax=unclassified Allobranchiibius TaxID=2649857 RepID=UPI001F2E0B31|nr:MULTISPECIES: DeoR/GlpR family DNA-binding transcription regulator [unclassified Allobranchiibius]UIJ35214.1 DeoR/GlpR family DNA-binding transcription regulator [Allobranchiibius sp. GilTou73]
MSIEPVAADSRQSRQMARQRAITEAVMAQGAVRIEELAERFDISVMTVHRDLDELESRGILRKSRGVATATATSLVESSDIYRTGREKREKEAIAIAAMDFVEPGQAILLDDSTTVAHMAPHLQSKSPLTVITNVLTLINELRGARGITLLSLGGEYYNWCSAFMGRMTTQAISNLRADTFLMSTAAITDDIVFHQALETVDIKRAMFDSASRRILLVDHTKFEKRALHALAPLSAFDTVIVDAGTPDQHVTRMRDQGIHVVVAPMRGVAGVPRGRSARGEFEH